MIPFLATVVVDLIVGLIALSKRNNPSALALAVFVFSLGLWQTELFLLTVVRDVDLLNPLFHLTRIGMFFAPVFLALLTWRTCGSQSAKFFVLVLLPGFATAAALGLLNNTVLPSVLHFAEDGYLPQPDAVFYAFIGLFLYMLFSSIGLGIGSYRKVPQREKRRIKWLLISLGLIFSLGGLSIYLVAYGAYLSKVVGALANMVFVSVLLYATINHHLTDVSSALSSLFSRVLVLGVLVSLFFSAIEYIDNSVPSVSSKLLGFLLLFIVLELYPVMLRLVRPSAKRLMLSRGYDVYTVTRDTRYAFKRSIEASDLLKVLDHLLLRIMRIDHYELSIVTDESTKEVILMRKLGSREAAEQVDAAAISQLQTGDPELIMIDEAVPALQKMLQQRGAIACFPLIQQEQLVGILYVGQMLSYQTPYYRYDDIRIFEWLISELPATVTRILLHDVLKDDLGEAQKTMSMIELMNQYNHDIKAPLSIIDGVVSNRLYDRDKHQRIILEQVARGTQLIALMGSVLRGQRERQTQPVDLQTLVQECMMLFERELDHVEYHFSEMSNVVGDSNDLKILFINLIKNTVEARPPGKPLEVLVEGGESAEHVWIRFSDNGVGMSDQQLSSVWTKTGSSKLNGNGLGLRTIKRIADEHGASIRVDRRPAGGLQFELGFPMRVQQLQQRLLEDIKL
ncbi:MAG: hypothetical protein KDJ38_05480 [Gammaproteobacteria bacterium]|nr:hypothetical protein [Gammaproteobacteria bacterium]